MQTEFPESHDEWISGHLYYDGALTRVIRGFAHPLVASLSAEQRITGFFFIRYGVGGPHVRLRLRPAEGVRDLVRNRMERLAEEFLAATPEDDLPEGAPIDSDNSFQVLPFEPEIERYGGPARIELSLDFFTLSSVAVLDHLSGLGQTTRSVYLAKAYEVLLCQTLAFATDESELADLLRYGADWFGRDAPKIVEKGEAVARTHKSQFLEIFLQTLSEVRSLLDRSDAFEPLPKSLFILGMRRLSAALHDADRPTRRRIGASQIHMTASRLGLINLEEVYLSRILSLTFDEARAVAADGLEGLYEAESVPSVGELLPMALAALSRDREEEQAGEGA